MTATQENAQMMTMEEIEKQFDGEWVILEDPIVNEQDEIIGGKLLAHSKNRDEVYQVALQQRPKHAASIYLGPMPDNIAINL